MRRTKEEAEETKRAILQSALDTFCEKGYAKTTFDEIAKRINLTKGAVYWHFRSKPDLLAALIDDYFDRQVMYVHQKMPGMNLKSFNDILNHYLYRIEFIMSTESNRKIGFFLICQMEWSEGVIQKIVPQVGIIENFWIELLKRGLDNLQKTGVITSRIDTDRMAHIITNCWIGTLGGFYGRRCNADLKEIVMQSMDIIFSGIKNERTEENAC